MVKEAEANKSEDEAKKEKVEAKNQAEGLIHSTEQNLKDHGDKISEEEKNVIETAVEDLKVAKESDDIDDIKSKTEALVQASMKLGEAIYKAQAEQNSATQPGSDQTFDETSSNDTSNQNEDVVDADFEEVDDDKKD